MRQPIASGTRLQAAFMAEAICEPIGGPSSGTLFGVATDRNPSGGPAAGMPGCLIIVCGLPGSGKTTVAKRLAVQRSGIRLSPDEWMEALGINLCDSTMRERIESLQWSTAKDLVTNGVTVILEWGTWSRSERDALRVEARNLGASAQLVYLDVPLEELWRRIQARNLEDPPIQRSDLDAWSRLFEPPDDQELRLYDTG